ncbi:hypothetical protein PSTG_09971 [Puccinia striiformis f. sp. tritici PST-78]|uniref:Uncharacterized protein n=2 Tax=Puccinia striiformis f. sp. tritici TaxID=168172 RepID=A0A0L0VBP4_9BASI|nr:hypothetical protein PSTG_09971 [Puccinia striiformis f. sp. tritici PST-78]
MQVKSPVDLRSSAELDRMDALLRATGITTPITMPSSPAVHLDVEACFNQLSNSQNQRPEDIVMRQALELYCSLISPPTTPAEPIKLGYKSQQDHLPMTPSGVFHCQDEYRPLSEAYEEIQGRPVHAGTDPNQHFRFGSSQNLPTHHNYLPHQTHQAHYSWSTPSCVSDHGTSDTDDMDDPFACYPVSHPLSTTQYSAYTPQANYSHLRRSSCEPSLHKGSHSYSSQQRIQISSQYGNLGGSPGMTKASTTDTRSTAAQPLARRSFFSPTTEPTADETKPTGRKRSFSVATFVKQRKSPSANPASLRISGPMPINTSHSASSSGTFSIPVRASRSSGARLSSVACLSPALELNEDISPVRPALPKPVPSRQASRSGVVSPADEQTSMDISRKYSSRPDTKSLWKTLRASTSRPSLAIERPLVL